MAAKIGGFVGLFTGWIVWQTVGGIGGLLLAIIVVVPVASALFIGLLSLISGGGKGQAADGAGSNAAATADDEHQGKG